MHMNKHMKPPASGGSVSIDIDGSKRNPWLKFFPTDWDSDLALKRCSMAARGLWIGMIGIMHQSTDRPGSFIVKSIVPTDDEAARLLGCSTREFRKLRAELENSGVFSRNPDGVIFSRRMRRDIEKAKKDKENGGRGGNPAVKRGVNPKDNREDKAQRPDTRDQRSCFLASRGESRPRPHVSSQNCPNNRNPRLMIWLRQRDFISGATRFGPNGSGSAITTWRTGHRPPTGRQNGGCGSVAWATSEWPHSDQNENRTKPVAHSTNAGRRKMVAPTTARRQIGPPAHAWPYHGDPRRPDARRSKPVLARAS